MKRQRRQVLYEWDQVLNKVLNRLDLEELRKIGKPSTETRYKEKMQLMQNCQCDHKVLPVTYSVSQKLWEFSDEFDIVFLNNSLIVIPTEKVVICKSFVCYVHIFYGCLCFDCIQIQLHLVKQENCSIQTCPSSLFILRRHYRHILTVFYPFHKINSSKHKNSMAFEMSYHNAIS